MIPVPLGLRWMHDLRKLSSPGVQYCPASLFSRLMMHPVVVMVIKSMVRKGADFFLDGLIVFRECFRGSSVASCSGVYCFVNKVNDMS